MAHTEPCDGEPMAGPHWTEELFLRHADVWLAVHERAWAYGEEQARDIHAILGKHGIGAGSRILDAPCGIGRRALGLAEEGFQVMAVDSNEIGIEAARSRAPPAVAERLRFVHATKDRSPGLEANARFEAILCMDHPVGREDERADTAFLTRLAGHLAPEGILVLELLHRDFFATRAKSFSFHVLGEIEQHEFRTFDPETGILELAWKFYHRDEESLRHRGGSEAKMRLLAPHEAASLLDSAGWRMMRAFGGWGRESVNAGRRKLVIVARPAARPSRTSRPP